MKKPLPKFDTEKEFIDWFQKTDLGDYFEPSDAIKLDFSHLKFTYLKNDKMISFRLPTELLKTLKAIAKKNRTKYQKLIRRILEENLARYL